MNDAQAPRVMLATAFGPSKDYCRPFWRQVVEGMQGIDALAVLFDGTPQVRDLPASVDVCQITLPMWDGGEDPLRYGRLARMRSALREAFLASDCDYLYWHDVDTIPPGDIIPRLLALDVPVATGAYSYRELTHAMQPILHCRPEDVTADLQRCDGYGMGCMLVRRDVLERTEFRSPEYWRDIDPQGLGEDWQWGVDSGVETVVDTRLSCWHCCGPDGKAADDSYDGWAGRIEFGPAVYAVVWMGSMEAVTNEFGTWRHGAVRVDLTPEQAAGLPAGFARSMAREMSLEWEETATLAARYSHFALDDTPVVALRRSFPWPEEKPNFARCVEGWLMPGTADVLRARLSNGTRVIVEVGSWLGMSAHFLAQMAPDAEIICIDTWEGSPEHEEDPHCAEMLPTLYERFLANTWDLRSRLTPIRRESVNGLIVLASFGVEPDLIYIDAAHDYESVMADIKAARELFPGAVLVGDDWGIPGVQSAASELLCALPEFGHNGCCWWLD